jgi:predicted DNA-binding protein (MmcQ/YjbR family)
MMSTKTFRELAPALPGAEEHPLFDKSSYRVNKKIFATLDMQNSIACLKLTPVDQSVFSGISRSAIYPVPNKWGVQGWTFVVLEKVRKSLIMDALTTAYYGAAVKKRTGNKKINS